MNFDIGFFELIIKTLNIMRKISMMLAVASLAFVACQKEQNEPNRQEEIRYTDFYIVSPKDSSKWLTIEEYNKMMESMPIEKEDTRGRNWVTCYYQNTAGEWVGGKTCTGTTTQGCSEAFGCRGGTFGS